VGKKKRTGQPRPGGDAGAAVAVVALCAVVAGTALAVDTQAAAAFDAPKRLIALIGTAVAASAAFAFRRPETPAGTPWREGPRLRRLALWLAAAALALALVSALVSPRRALALDTMRTVGVLALLIPLGASRVFPKGRTSLPAVFLAACAANAAIAILEARGIYSPFQLETSGGRQETGAFAGNVGYLAIALALASVVALGILVAARRPAPKVLCGAALIVFAAGLLVNQNVTALMAALTGAAVLLVLRFHKRAALPMGAAVAAVAIGVFAYGPLRHRAQELSRAVATNNWDAVVSFRGGPWAAALEMTRDRPLLGFGPGTFAAEYVPHRLAAEIRARRRFVSPLLTSSYAEAHSDYLQVASDAGVPAALLAIGAAGCLLVATVATAWRRGSPEAIVLAAMLATGAAAALTWFPFQRPITAVPLLIAAGRAWRIAGESPAEGGEA
jgi:O-antigen ligase